MRASIRSSRELAALAGVAALALGVSGCAKSVGECGDDGEACAELVNIHAEACAQAWQLRAGDRKRRNCIAAVRTVKRQEVKAAVPGLIKLLGVPESGVPDDRHREEAARILGRLADPSAIKPLMTAFEVQVSAGRDPQARQVAQTNEQIVEALGALKAKAAVPMLLEALDKSADRQVVRKSVRALGRIGDPSAVPALSKIALTDPNKFMRKTAVVALGNIGDPSAADALIQMMFIEMGGVSFYREASLALFQVGPEVAPALLETMALKNEKVNAYFEASGGLKESAIKAKCGYVLGDLRDERAFEPLLVAFKEAAEKNDPVVLVFATTPLAVLGDKRAIPLLASRMGTLDPSQRDPIMRALVQLGAVEVLDRMIETIPKSHFLESCVRTGASRQECDSERTKPSLFRAQKASIDHVTNLAGGDRLEALTALLKQEKDPAIRKYFKARLKRVLVAAECKENAGCWARKLSDSDPLLRERAAWTLLRLKDKSVASALAEALDDKDNNVRSAAIQAYWELGNKSAIPVIEKTLEREEGSLDYVRVNEDLKRLLIALKRA